MTIREYAESFVVESAFYLKARRCTIVCGHVNERYHRVPLGLRVYRNGKLLFRSQVGSIPMTSYRTPPEDLATHINIVLYDTVPGQIQAGDEIRFDPQEDANGTV